ncbi:hypothetical protein CHINAEXTREME_08425 [Halobiforma lacisalsi AJ5]|uniref:Uncharacterized protein n=1 Tax=Natronobacterium lacisalsi AJ5 TaxID=358396 RepID=M0LZA8_NATLA|nr:hypothetical protein [Halobiforma lacisalsi]APW97803.1 hypothetical protein CHINAEXTREME_08425 [Halobiforma lacisalsi AJ5]EMA37450.1 hypothetical protein C445_01146 [Halobiforma lacisalsi AJ5]
MTANGGDRTGLGFAGRGNENWFRFGIYLAFLYATFTLAIVYLLSLDQTFGLVAAVVGGIAFGLAIMIYVFYFT